MSTWTLLNWGGICFQTSHGYWFRCIVESMGHPQTRNVSEGSSSFFWGTGRPLQHQKVCRNLLKGTSSLANSWKALLDASGKDAFASFNLRALPRHNWNVMSGRSCEAFQLGVSTHIGSTLWIKKSHCTFLLSPLFSPADMKELQLLLNTNPPLRNLNHLSK